MLIKKYTIFLICRFGIIKLSVENFLLKKYQICQRIFKYYIYIYIYIWNKINTIV